MPEANLNQNPQTTQPPQKPKRNWKKISLILLVVLFLVSLVGIGLYLLIPKSVQEEPKPIPQQSQKQTTPSAEPATPSAQKDETTNWKVYSSSEGEFSIKYPKDFSVKETNGVIRGIYFNSPDKAETTPPIVTLTEGGFIHVQVTDAKTNSLETEFKNVLQSSRVESRSNSTIDGVAAIRAVYIPNGTAPSDKAEWVFAIKNGKRYSIVAWAAENDRQEINKMFNLMISTFKFLSSTSSE